LHRQEIGWEDRLWSTCKVSSWTVLNSTFLVV